MDIGNKDVQKQMRSSQKSAIYFNTFNQIIMLTLTGDVMVLFVSDVLKFSSETTAFLLSLIPFVALIRIPLISILKNFSWNDLIKKSVIIKILCVLAILFIPTSNMNKYIFISIIVVYRIAAEFGGGMCWQPLMRSITDDKSRGEFFGRMRFVFKIFTSVYLLGINIFIGKNISEKNYHILLGISLIGLLIQLFTIGNIKIPEESKINDANHTNLSLKEVLIKYYKPNENLFKALVLHSVFIFVGFKVNVLYLKNILHYSSKIVSIYISLFTFSGIFILPIIGKRIDKNINRSVNFTILSYVIYAVVLLFLPYEDNTYLAIIGVVLLGALAGIIVSTASLIATVLFHKAIKDLSQSFAIINIYQLVLFVVMFLSINFLGFMVSNSEKIKIYIFDYKFDLYRVAFLALIILFMPIFKRFSNSVSWDFPYYYKKIK